MTQTELEQEIREALIRLADRELPESEAARLTADWTPSERFLRRMERAWRRYEAKPYRQRLFRAAVIALLLLGLSLSLNPQVRAYVQRVFQQVVQGMDMEYRFREDGTEADPELKTQWAPGWLPEGYALVEDVQMSTVTYRKYYNKKNERISIQYGSLHQGVVLSLDTLTHEIMEVSVNGTTAQFYHSTVENENNMLFWVKRQNHQEIYFYISGLLSENEIIRVAENLEEEKGNSY